MKYYYSTLLALNTQKDIIIQTNSVQWKICHRAIIYILMSAKWNNLKHSTKQFQTNSRLDGKEFITPEVSKGDDTRQSRVHLRLIG
jgi:hypothetical protein